MGKIRVLNEGTINQIAAGEVVENPASVVKELIENSLDAGSTKIWVEIRGGGFQLIQVADDGCGMSGDDAVLSFERHATSKISKIEDLNRLSSMGFRGEALASIAAVSKVDLVTAEEGKDATEVEVDGGVIRGVRAASRSRGTTISVRSLFYNVPARKKFQKSPLATTSEIHKLIFALALAHPEVGFELVSNDTVLLSVAAENDFSLLAKLENRIEEMFDNGFLQGRRSLVQEKEGYVIEGWIGSPADDRINRSGQYLFVNRRAVISPVVSGAIKAGYGHRLDERRYPIFVVHLSIPAEEVDVNVHPQKREVRFQDEEKLKTFLEQGVRAVFHQEMPVGTVSFAETAPMKFQETVLHFREEPREEAADWIEDPEVIGLYGTYLLLNGATVSGEEGIVWVHLQKAQEKVLLKEMQTVDGKSQGLLLPVPVTLSKEQQLDFQEKETVLKQVGFSMEPSGKESYLIHAIPAFIEPSEAAEAVHEILQGEEVFKKLATFAVRGKKQFMIQEALALWRQVKDTNDKEIIAKTGRDEIDHFFR